MNPVGRGPLKSFNETVEKLFHYIKGGRMTDISTAKEIIATIPAPACNLCGARGVLLHEGLSDPWAGAPGEWNLKNCPNPDCGLVWLDPMPSRKDLWKAYRVYFTHRDYVPAVDEKIDGLNFLLLKICKPLYKFFEHAVGMRALEKKWRKQMDGMFLGKGSAGNRLLDVGCGKGDLLARLRPHGWNGEGLEVDAEAAASARTQQGLKVYEGELASHRFPDHSFDAITMNHVIEHVHDPVSLMGECLRLLKPGGRMVMATPNIRSLVYGRFGGNCSLLDPPRHLHLFTKRNLKECAARAGFRSVDSWCVPGYAEGGALRVSIEREEAFTGRKRGEFPKWLEASYLKAMAYYRFFVNGEEEVGEEIFLMAVKDN
jgi:2-polyprenyl-3-methyl-5-hydroxy-6-metoxy-1,4-benzoquinol methylase